jgi:hypothetical protein
MGDEETTREIFPTNPLSRSHPMKALKIVMLTLALAAGAAAAAQAGNGDDCHSKSTHGLWDCR